MFIQRHTAYKMWIKDIVSSEYIQKDDESDYIIFNDKHVSRVRIIATVVNKFTYDEKKSGTLVLDDSTGIINIRAWENEYHLINDINIGDLIQVIGRIRKYNDNVYLTPEIIKKVNPNKFVLWNIELLNNKQKIQKKEDVNFKEKMLEKIREKQDNGITLEELIKIVGDKETCQEILKELLEEGSIFEPRAGVYKLIS